MRCIILSYRNARKGWIFCPKPTASNWQIQSLKPGLQSSCTSYSWIALNWLCACGLNQPGNTLSFRFFTCLDPLKMGFFVFTKQLTTVLPWGSFSCTDLLSHKVLGHHAKVDVLDTVTTVLSVSPFCFVPGLSDSVLGLGSLGLGFLS